MVQISNRKRLLTPQVLEGLAIVGILTIGAAVPLALGAFAAVYVAAARQDPKMVRKHLHYLKKRGYISVLGPEGKVMVEITSRGRERLESYRLRQLSIKKPRHWDKKWRLAAFDLPAEERSKRNRLRHRLKELGFYQVQKSVWIHPYDCQEEINFLRNCIGVDSNELFLATAESIEGEGRLKKIFKLV